MRPFRLPAIVVADETWTARARVVADALERLG
jgi:hypothetical protein